MTALEFFERFTRRSALQSLLQFVHNVCQFNGILTHQIRAAKVNRLAREQVYENQLVFRGLLAVFFANQLAIGADWEIRDEDAMVLVIPPGSNEGMDKCDFAVRAGCRRIHSLQDSSGQEREEQSESRHTRSMISGSILS